MKTTIDLPEELVREIKLRALLQRRTVKDLVAEYLRQGLGWTAPPATIHPPTATLLELDAAGIPMIRCRPSAPAAAMSVEELLALEQELGTGEDLQRAGLTS